MGWAKHLLFGAVGLEASLSYLSLETSCCANGYIDMPGSLDYIRSVLGLDLSILNFISQKLAVSLTVLAQQFKVPAEQMKEKILPLVAAKLVDEQKASTDVVYAITADGMKEVERSSKKGLAAYF